MKRCLHAVLVILVFAVLAQAERPPQSREDAKLALSGTVKKIATKTTEFGGDGVRSDYTAKIVVDSVEKGANVKVGDTISVTWFHVTKRPTAPLVGAFGHGYGINEKDKAKFWLMDSGKTTPWVVIYNKNGIEKIQK